MENISLQFINLYLLYLIFFFSLFLGGGGDLFLGGKRVKVSPRGLNYDIIV